jgi:hypothetical protein
MRTEGESDMAMLHMVSNPALVPRHDAVTYFYWQWYNAVVRQLSLSSKTFMLQQPCLPLPMTTPGIWSLFNVVPPRSLVYDMATSSADQFYAGYRDIVNQLVPGAPTDMRQVLGEDFAAWHAYAKGLTPLPATSDLGEVFFNWAIIHCPEKAAAGRAAFNAMVNDPVNIATTEVAHAGFVNGVPPFSATIGDVRSVLRNSPGASISFDSAKESSDVSTTWAQGAMSGLPRPSEFLMGIEGDAGWRRINEKASHSQLIIEVVFEAMGVVSAGPEGWYNPALLARAFHDQGAGGVWRRGRADWERAFGERGRLRHIVRSLVLVDGIKVKVTSTAQYSQREQRDIQAAFGGGIWPLVGMNGHGGLSTKVKFERDGAAVFTTTSQRDNICVFGANVVPVSACVGGTGEVPRSG